MEKGVRRRQAEHRNAADQKQSGSEQSPSPEAQGLAGSPHNLHTGQKSQCQ